MKYSFSWSMKECRSQTAGFWEMVDVYGLVDLGFEGHMWTFEKKVAGGSYRRVWLDHALAFTDWSAQFLLAHVQHLTSAASSHGPIELRWDIRQPSTGSRRGRRSFRYELMWERHSEFGDVLAQAWEN